MGPHKLGLALVALGLLAVTILIGYAALTGPAYETAPKWDDGSDQGHSQLSEALAQQAEVRVIESSLGTLPNEAGDGDMLFLFPSYRPATSTEIRQVAGFVEDGGHLVLAADGGHADAWAKAFGFRFQGLPALLPPDQAVPCVETTVPTPRDVGMACLPSPTVFPNVTRLLSDPEQTFGATGETQKPVFLDVDGNDILSLGDQGPLNATTSLALAHGEGRVDVIADSDLWRNEVLDDRSENLRLVTQLAAEMDEDGTVYLDSSGITPGARARVIGLLYRALSAPSGLQIAGLSLLFVGTAGGAVSLPRVVPWTPHDPEDHPIDPHREERILAVVEDVNDSDDTFDGTSNGIERPND